MNCDTPDNRDVVSVPLSTTSMGHAQRKVQIIDVAQEARVIVAQEAHGIKVIIIDRGTRSTSQIIITTVCKHILRDCLVQCTIYKTLTAHGYRNMCSPAGAGGRRCRGE